MTATATRERGIIMTGESVRAVMAGRKTQTRRVMLPQPTPSTCAGQPMWGHAKLGGQFGEHVFGPCAAKLIPCPYGAVGDRLWVRESWRAWATVGAGDMVRTEYAADGKTTDQHITTEWSVPKSVERGQWGPSIHMPRWASRLTLEITDVRVERVQDVSEADAIAEGVSHWNCGHPDCYDDAGNVGKHYGPRGAFMEAWNRLNAARGYPWDSNPWVWVVEFRPDR